jgi:hypothetical protein
MATILTFSTLPNIYIKKNNMERIYRNLDDATKLRISQKLKGRTMSDSHKQAISNAMKAYWATIPYRPNENNECNNHCHETNMQKSNTN